MLAAVPDDQSALFGEPRKVATKRLRGVGGNPDLEVLLHANLRPVVRELAQTPEASPTNRFRLAGGVLGGRKNRVI